jgi:DNA-binding transcriptional MocR family regulator
VPAQYQIAGKTAAEIMASVEAGVRSGALRGGEGLPPVRDLADRLGVSNGTVASAYKGLRARGVVETAGRNGTRVRRNPPLVSDMGDTRAARQLPVAKGAHDVSHGQPDPALLPPLPVHLRRLAANPHNPTNYRNPGPDPALIGAARAGFKMDGVAADAITVTSGALDAIERVLTSHLRPADAVGVEDPGWANLFDLLATLGLHPTPMPVDAAGPTVAGVQAALDSGVRAIIVTTRAHNPTGAAVTPARAKALRKALGACPDVLVIEDDHSAQLSSLPVAPLTGATRRWAFVRSVSKPLGPDLRLAVLAGDDETISRVEGRQRFGAGWVSTILQRLVLDMWTDDKVTAMVREAGRAYDQRRQALIEALAARRIAAAPAPTGINVWIPVSDETAVVTRLRDAGWAVAPGSLYRIASSPGVRVSISALTAAQIPAFADAVAQAMGRTVSARNS